LATRTAFCVEAPMKGIEAIRRSNSVFDILVNWASKSRSHPLVPWPYSSELINCSMQLPVEESRDSFKTGPQTPSRRCRHPLECKDRPQPQHILKSRAVILECCGFQQLRLSAATAKDLHPAARHCCLHRVPAGAAAKPLCGGRGFRGWKGRGPSAVDSTPPGAPPTYPDPDQQGNDLSESQGDRIWSGAGSFPCGCGFPNPPTNCLNFSLWRDLFVWRIWGGYSGRWRSGWGGVY